jgi:hypothetical protein
VIDDRDLERVARLGLMRFDLNLQENPWVGTDVIWGTGLHDIDHVTDLMLLAMTNPMWRASYPNEITFKLDTGIDGKDSSWQRCCLEDLVKLRALFIAMWGEVNKVTNWTVGD